MKKQRRRDGGAKSAPIAQPGRLLGIAARAVRTVVDLLFPERCLLCAQPLEWGGSRPAPVCPDCSGGLRPLRGRCCSVCGLPLISEETLCTRCRDRSFAFDLHRALFEYRGDVRELVHQFKFKGRARLGALFAVFFNREKAWPGRPDLVVPVPSRGRAVRAYGFAPVELLSRAFARQAGMECRDCLIRLPGESQKTLVYEERLANLKGKIGYQAAPDLLRGRAVVLIDDIFTTGATAHECAAVLKAQGALSVVVLTIAMEI